MTPTEQLHIAELRFARRLALDRLAIVGDEGLS